MLEVVKPGLETSVQDLPGRLGYWEQGFPPSGPMDVWSFRLANLLVGNAANDAGLECQFIGPTLRFRGDAAIAVTGANMSAALDGSAIPMWETVRVRAGQVLMLGPALTGARTYLAICGGIDVPEVLGSRSTFHVAGIGGMDGGALKAGAGGSRRHSGHTAVAVAPCAGGVPPGDFDRPALDNRDLRGSQRRLDRGGNQTDIL